jgi:hypothetical protein
MKPLLFLHIGTHKTGSTAIQRALPVGSAAALKAGLVRLDIHGDVARSSWTEDDARALRASLAGQIVPGVSRYLLTCEGFSGDPLRGYANAPVAAARLRAATADFDVRVVVFLRRQDDFLESIYTQLIHQGGSQSFDDFLHSLPPGGPDWQRLLDTYATEFGRENLVVRRYHSAFYPRPESLLEDFCAILGIPCNSLVKADATPNQGYSHEAQELARICNPHLDGAGRRQLRQLLQKISPKPVFQSYAYLDLPARRSLLAACAESNAAVAREFFHGEPLFPEPADATTTSAHSEPLVATLVKMLLENQRGSRLVRLAGKIDRALGGLKRSSTQP